MIRKYKWIAASSLMAASIAFTAQQASGQIAVAPSRAPVATETIQAGQTTLVRSSRHTVVQYDLSLSANQVLARAQADAQALGFEIFKTMAVQNMVVLHGAPDDVAAALSGAEGVPPLRLAPAYQRNGDRHQLSMIAFTSRAAIRFAANSTEAERAEWLRINNFRRVLETPMGYVLIETGREPNAEMIEFTERLQNDEAIVAEAIYEFVFTGEPTASDSIEINDPLFNQQWWLFNDGRNTLRPNLDTLQDTDTPLAWMFNQRNIKARGETDPTGMRKFGDAVIGVFDSGVEINHEDLAPSMDPRFGRDFVEGGVPNPAASLLGAHGTAVAGLIAAAPNRDGIVGMAPGARIYAVRVFAADYSTTNLRILTGLQDATARNVDGNVHPYNLPLDLDCNLAQSIESGLRSSWEAGRIGRGMANLAAAGNFVSQVGYPAMSPWVIAVGAVNSSGERVPSDPSTAPEVHDSNWGGLGVDIVMPSFTRRADSDASPFSAPITSTDITGPVGIAAGNYGTFSAVNAFQGITPPGSNFTPFVPEPFPLPYCPVNTTATRGTPFMGSSFAAGLSGGVLAMLISDPRYHDLRPIPDPFDRPNQVGRSLPITREQRRERVTHGEESLLRVMAVTADLPMEDREFAVRTGSRQERAAKGGPLAYIDNYNEFHGFGRPNLANAIASPEALPSRDSLHRGLLHPEPVYSVRFGRYAPLGAEQDEELAGDLRQGWEELQGASITVGVGDNIVTISPYMEPMNAIYFENGNILRPELGEEDMTYPFAWTDSLPLALDNTDQDSNDVPINLLWNPSGRYQANRQVGLVGPSIAAPSERTPMVVEIDIAHQLGVENATVVRSSFGVLYADVAREIDYIVLDMIHDDPVVEGQRRRIELARITGDSRRGFKNRLVPGASVIEVSDWGNARRVFWGDGDDNIYEPWRPNEGIAQGMLVRTYRFYAPPIPEGIGTFNFELRLIPGPSYLPSYNTDEEPKQLLSVLRDHLGFVFTGLRVFNLQEEYMDYRARNLFEVSDGYFPTWNAVGDRLHVAQNRFQDLGTGISVVDPSPSYLFLTEEDAAELDGPAGVFDRTNPNSFRDRRNVRYIETRDRVTGMKSHPYFDYIAVTTTGSQGDFLNLMTGDGINFGPMLSSTESIGARDPFWSADGSTLLFASPNYIRLLTLDGNFNVLNVETVISSSTSILSDFRSPVISPDGGLVFFTARRTDGQSTTTALQIYASTRLGRLVSYREDFRLPFLPGWEGVDIFDLDLSVSGRRLIFSANASAPPVPGELASAPVVQSANPSPNARLFLINNMHHVEANNDEPLYATVPLLGVDARFPKVSGRYARLSPVSNEIAWMAYSTTSGPNDLSSEARIVRQPLATGEWLGPPQNNVTPTPVPSVTPTGTPDIPNEALVVVRAEGTFGNDREGWVFGGAPGFHDLPANRYTQDDGTPRIVAPGLISLSSGANGPVADQNVLLATIRFRAYTPGFTPIRIRTATPNSSTLMDGDFRALPFDALEGGADVVDAVKVLNVDPLLYFQFPTGTAQVRDEEFDVQIRLNGNGGRTQNFQLFLEFDPEVLQFRFGTVNTAIFHNQVRGSLELVTNSTNNTFGFFETDPGRLRVEQDSLYLFRAFVRGVSGSNDLSRMPAMRLRVNSPSFESSFEAITQAAGSDLSLIPETTRVRPYDLLFRPPAERYNIPESNPNTARGGLFNAPLSGQSYTVSFDLFNFSPGIDPTSGFRLEGYKFYRLDDRRVIDAAGSLKRQGTVVKAVRDSWIVPTNQSAAQQGFWNFGPPAEFNPYRPLQPVPSSTGLGLRLTGQGNSFGYWDNSRIYLPLSANTETQAWINEVARVADDPGTGEAERDAAWLEIAGLAGTNLAGWRVTAYSETGRVKPLANPVLSGSIPDQRDGFGTVRHNLVYEPTPEGQPYEPAVGILFQSPSGQIVQFISFNITLQAVDGPAAGLVSQFTTGLTDVDQAAGRTAQLFGTGTRLADFQWKHQPAPASSGAFNSQQAIAAYRNVWINELHHRNEGADINKGVEIAGRSGVNLAGWRLVFYNPEGNRVGGRNLTGIIPSLDGNIGALWFEAPALVSAAGGAVALINREGFVVEFLGYGAATRANDDAAAGLVATEIPAEPENGSANGSLQRVGLGVHAGDFGWFPTQVIRSPGALNIDQVVGTEVYRATFSVRNAGELDATRIPSLRVRFGTSDFQRIVVSTALANGASATNTVPTTGSPRDYETYLVFEGVPTNLARLFAAYDILSFRPDQTVTTQVMEMTGLRVERLLIPDYPQP